jgi:histidinol dehydrogenase
LEFVGENMLKVISKNLEAEILLIKKRAGQLSDPVKLVTVQKIIADVIKRGDKACFEYTQKFDGVKLDKKNFPIAPIELELAHSQANPALIQAMRKAIANISEYALRQVPQSWTYERANKATLGMRFLPLKRVGIYIPGGQAVYPSSVLMTAVIAKVSGVDEIVVMCPPGPNGLPPAAILTACVEVGVTEVYPLGGAQAIAAMAYGTQSIKPVDKIVGPGNIYVTLAKKEVFGKVGIDGLAGPSESVIIADATAKAEWVARDLLIQAEHDPLAASILITPDKTLAKKVSKEITKLVAQAPRKKIIEASLKKWGRIFIAKDIDQACAISNWLAPEHLHVVIKDPYSAVNKITNAGAIFLGEYTPESVGDYIAGPSHVLPTHGTARYASPLAVADFLRFSSLVEYSQQALKEEAAMIQTLTQAEKLSAHGEAIQTRIAE